GAALSPADERPEFLVRGAGPALADQLADIGPADTTEDAIQHGREWLTVGEGMAPHCDLHHVAGNACQRLRPRARRHGCVLGVRSVAACHSEDPVTDMQIQFPGWNVL